jgi:hypothetical protein
VIDYLLKGLDSVGFRNIRPLTILRVLLTFSFSSQLWKREGGVMVGEATFGVVESVIGTCFDIRKCSGVIGAKGDSREKVVIRDLSYVAICGLSGQVLRSNGVFGVAHVGDGIGGVFTFCPGE